MSTVQPITPYQPTPGVLAALNSSPRQPQYPTTLSLVSTTPTQTSSDFGAIRQLPVNVLTTMASQQALQNNLQTAAQKLARGIIEGPGGATLAQLSQPGQFIKPGAGEFLQKLMQNNPTLPFTKVASRVLFTGNGGVTSPAAIVQNVSAQLSSVNNSIKQATSILTNTGVLTGNENPIQAAGSIMAATVAGANTVASILSVPQTVASALGSANSLIGNAMAAGTFAAGLADKAASGIDGIVSSINSITSNTLGSLSSGITDFLQKSPIGNLSALVSPLAGTMQNAFNLAEQAFGSLKANLPNNLGGLPEIVNLQASKALSSIRDHDLAADELINAEALFAEARKALTFDQSASVLQAVRDAESKISQAKQKLASTASAIMQGTNTITSQLGTSLFGGASAQALNTIATAGASGLLNLPTSLNTGLNSIPGGSGAFLNQISGATSNIMDTVKNVSANLPGQLSSAANILANPSRLAGDLVNNATQALGSITGNLTQNFNNVGNSINTALSGATGAINAISGAANSGVAGLASKMISSLTSFGDAPGQIKNAITAINTFGQVKAAMSSVIDATMDVRVPPPVFEEIMPTFEPNKYTQAQVNAQDTINELFAEREIANNNYINAVEAANESNAPEDWTEVDNAWEELNNIDERIKAAQNSYETLIAL